MSKLKPENVQLIRDFDKIAVRKARESYGLRESSQPGDGLFINIKCILVWFLFHTSEPKINLQQHLSNSHFCCVF